MEMSSPLDLIQDNGNRFKKRKARFTFSEVHILLDEVRKYRHIIVGKFNRGVPTEVKKLKWAQITARVNEIGECQREVIEIIKKWSDLKCDTKRKVAAMRTGATPHRGLNSRMSRDLTQIEQIVHQILEMDDDAPPSSGEFGPVEEDDDDRHEEDDVLEGEDMARYHDSSPNGGLETLSMSMPPPFPKEDSSLPTYSGSSRESSQHFFETQYEIPANEDTEVAFMDSDDDQRGDRGPSARTIRPPEDHRANNGIPRASPSSSTAAAASSSSSSFFGPAHHTAPVPPFSAGPPPPPAPEGGPWAREALLRDASLSLREQHATNLLLETVSRSLELLSESVQQLAETQQEFVRESLHLQRETVQVLRDFTGGAIALMHDKLNGRPAL